MIGLLEDCANEFGDPYLGSKLAAIKSDEVISFYNL